MVGSLVDEGRSDLSCGGETGKPQRLLLQPVKGSFELSVEIIEMLVSILPVTDDEHDDKALLENVIDDPVIGPRPDTEEIRMALNLFKAPRARVFGKLFKSANDALLNRTGKLFYFTFGSR
jgi:hypothetical protein